MSSFKKCIAGSSEKHLRINDDFFGVFLSIVWNSVRLGSPARGIVTKTT